MAAFALRDTGVDGAAVFRFWVDLARTALYGKRDASAGAFRDMNHASLPLPKVVQIPDPCRIGDIRRGPLIGGYSAC